MPRVRREAFELLEPVEHDAQLRRPDHGSSRVRQKAAAVRRDADITWGMRCFEEHRRLANVENRACLHRHDHEPPAAPIVKMTAVSRPSGLSAFTARDGGSRPWSRKWLDVDRTVPPSSASKARKRPSGENAAADSLKGVAINGIVLPLA